MKTTVIYSFAGPAGNLLGITMGQDLGTRTYDSTPYLPKVGEIVSLSYGSDIAQSAGFTVQSVQADMTKQDVDAFHISVTLA